MTTPGAGVKITASHDRMTPVLVVTGNVIGCMLTNQNEACISEVVYEAA